MELKKYYLGENMTQNQQYKELLAEKLLREFEIRNFKGHYCKTKEEALQLILDILPKDSLVSCGGSTSLKEIGLIDALVDGSYNFINPYKATSIAEKEIVMRKALMSDYYFMSANAISESGEIVNADSFGNKIGALVFGPKKVVIVAGTNKVVNNLDAAINRVKNYVIRNIVLNYNQDYSYLEDLSESAETECCQLLITSNTVTRGRIEIILVGESLGC